MFCPYQAQGTPRSYQRQGILHSYASDHPTGAATLPTDRTGVGAQHAVPLPGAGHACTQDAAVATWDAAALRPCQRPPPKVSGEGVTGYLHGVRHTGPGGVPRYCLGAPVAQVGERATELRQRGVTGGAPSLDDAGVVNLRCRQPQKDGATQVTRPTSYLSLAANYALSLHLGVAIASPGIAGLAIGWAWRSTACRAPTTCCACTRATACPVPTACCADRRPHPHRPPRRRAPTRHPAPPTRLPKASGSRRLCLARSA